MFEYTTAIRKLRKLKKRIRVVRGGTSAGKTFGIIPVLINRCQREEGLEISIVSESIPHLRRGALKDFLKIMMDTNRFLSAQFNKSTLKYTFTNGSYIEFFSADQPDRLRGARRTDLYVNECNNVPFDSYYQLAIRTSGTIWLDYNPVSRFWVDKEIIGQPDTDFIWWKVYGLGQIGSLEGVCIPDWKPIDLPEDARLLCYGMDFGYSNDPTTLIAAYKWNNAYIFDEVIYKKGLLNSDISNLLKAHDVTDIVYADSAEPKSIAELGHYGHKVLPCVKGKDSIVHGLNLINQNEVYITNRSTNLINELRNYIWIKDREGNKMNKPIDAFNHCIDAMRYALSTQLDNPNRGQYHIR